MCMTDVGTRSHRVQPFGRCLTRPIPAVAPYNGSVDRPSQQTCQQVLDRETSAVIEAKLFPATLLRSHPVCNYPPCNATFLVAMGETRRSSRIAAQPKKEEAPKPARKPAKKRSTGDAVGEDGPAAKKVLVAFLRFFFLKGNGFFFVL